MKYFFPMLIFAAVVVATTGCQNVKSTQKEQTNPEPAAGIEPAAITEVAMEDESPLLLDDEPDENMSSESMADNSRCFVCHINYMQEDIAVNHARQGMGCANCHGESDEHIADESWASGGNGTAPDIMYPREKINPFCMGCHTKEKIDSEQHKPLFASSNNDKYCTDCHGDHRLAERKCKWK
jgi:hypothetical protein